MSAGGVTGLKPPQRVLLNLGSLPPKQKVHEMKEKAANFPRTPSKTNPNNPPWPAFRGYHEYSFAHATMSVRLPTILGKAIGDVHQTLNQETEEDRIIDLVNCIHRMEDLMDDLQGNSKLRPIIDDGAGDIALWNKEIAKYFQEKDFMNAPWLFAEAYKYRRLRECFSMSKYWAEYDVFFRQKCDTFARSKLAVFELASRFCEPYTYDEGLDEAAKLERRKLTFRELIQVCLWGNSTDLSLLIDVGASFTFFALCFNSLTVCAFPFLQMSEEHIKKLQASGQDALAASEKNIIGNHLEELTELVMKIRGGRIDMVLDNAGFELYCDLVYSDWLIQSGICDKIVFHGKKIAVVRLGCHSEGLGLAHQLVCLRLPISRRERGRDGSAPSDGTAVETVRKGGQVAVPSTPILVHRLHLLRPPDGGSRRVPRPA